ncbi:hypothetical protein [Azohydromonas sediminis]|uniref:hypothetical protein n=1 Tax=Azohydromonas sediminis TaxID=2259674 RepID=UPI000E6590F7|nr:hypothetical protein [Azohydromonas sediminis]
MASPRKTKAPEPAPEAVLPDDLTPPDSEGLVQHPDGWYWLAPDGKNQFGPFETAEEARADMLAADDDEGVEPGETLQEAEEELGIADWIDPETGEPAEETHTRLEDH